jgi:hypothetical protein
MGFRVKVAPGVRMGFSKSGVSYSVGGKGMRVTKRADGRVTGTVGGGGMSYSATVGSTGRRRPRSRSSRSAPAEAWGPPRPTKPGVFSAAGEKALFRAVQAQDWAAIEKVIQDHPDHAHLAAAFVGLERLASGRDAARARELLTWVFESGQDPAQHPFVQRYANLRLTLDIAPGVTVELPTSRDAVGLG